MRGWPKIARWFHIGFSIAFLLTGSGCVVWYEAQFASLSDARAAYNELPLHCSPNIEQNESLNYVTSLLLPGSYPLVPPAARHIPQPNLAAFHGKFGGGSDSLPSVICEVEIPQKERRLLTVNLRQGRSLLRGGVTDKVISQRAEPHAVGAVVAQLISLLIPTSSSEDYAVYYTITFGEEDKGYHSNYSYTIRKKGIAHSFLLPFAWLNLFTTSESDILEEVHAMFLQDVMKDGYIEYYMKPSVQEVKEQANIEMPIAP